MLVSDVYRVMDNEDKVVILDTRKDKYNVVYSGTADYIPSKYMFEGVYGLSVLDDAIKIDIRTWMKGDYIDE